MAFSSGIEWIDESASARKKEVCYSHMYIVIYLLLHDDKNFNYKITFSGIKKDKKK